MGTTNGWDTRRSHPAAALGPELLRQPDMALAESPVQADVWSPALATMASDATPSSGLTGIKRQALELHPDRRRRHDQQRRAEPVRRRPWGPAPEPMRAPRPAAEPFTGVAPVRSRQEVALVESFETYRPSFEALFDRWWSNFALLDRPEAERLESLTVKLVGSPEQARAGGQGRLWVPARATCGTCGGAGAVGFYECWPKKPWTAPSSIGWSGAKCLAPRSRSRPCRCRVR